VDKISATEARSVLRLTLQRWHVGKFAALLIYHVVMLVWSSQVIRNTCGNIRAKCLVLYCFGL